MNVALRWKWRFCDRRDFITLRIDDIYIVIYCSTLICVVVYHELWHIPGSFDVSIETRAM
jgi:hypothetical protein